MATSDNNRSNTVLAEHERRAMEEYFTQEEKFMAAKDYAAGNDNSLNHIFRLKAVSTIASYSRFHSIDAFIPYLAMNYFDRFISKNALPHYTGRWFEEVEMVAVCCLGLAWKMRTGTFNYLKFLSSRKTYQIGIKQILEIELLILDGLEWLMRPITALCLVMYFYDTIPECRFSLQKANEIIVRAQGEMFSAKFRPSVIAASAILAASRHLKSTESENNINILNQCRNVKLDKKQVYTCTAEMLTMCDKLVILEVPNRREPPEEQSTGQPGKGRMQQGSDIQEEQDLSIRRRPGKEKIGAVSEIQEEQDLSIRRRPGKEKIGAVSEIQEEQDLSIARRPGKEKIGAVHETQEEPVSEEDERYMRFELKWMIVKNRDIDFNIGMVPRRPPRN